MKENHYRAFLPAVLEVQETPPSPAGRMIIWSIIILFVVSIVWAAYGRVDIVAVTRGKIVVSDLSRPVSSSVVAQVIEVAVSEGQHVQKGDVLIRLNSKALEARYEENVLRQKTNRFHIARLELLRKHYQDIKAPSELPADYFSEDPLFGKQVSLQLAAEINNDRQEKAVLRDSMVVLNAQKTGYRSQKEQSLRLLPIYAEQHRALSSLYKKNLTSRDSVLEIQKKLTEAEYALQSAEAKVVEIGASYHQAESEYQARITDKLESVEQQLAEKTLENRVLEKQLKELTGQIAQYTLVAPVEGIVDALVFRDAGGAVDAPQELLKIVPDNEILSAEVMVNNQDVGFLRPEQNVTLKIDTFDFTRYGWVNGTLRKISADATEDKNQGLIYKATIELSQKYLIIDGREMALEPGMQVTAEVKTGRRTILSYLLSPVMEALESVGKQR
ncbi:HlyD family type I secretion periplasmic adaptor subunit [Scandinavium goeteborgense]|uniref:HlyD family type I secretion periplasmic adaptor subunit n=1 Tax=Scandinavium goeteborgense TaxID=1851514 RepID=UPI001571D3F0|nr:HlyD family type I secretion periplasmic adaptor subunit [Scandinavium goeteborgense]QKN83270.1 HlyD family type I secretion periplasmic adaptor subunit [Scandinavium goeteborgense]